MSGQQSLDKKVLATTEQQMKCFSFEPWMYMNIYHVHPVVIPYSLPYPNVSLILLRHNWTCFGLKVVFPWQQPLHSEIGFDLYDVRMLAKHIRFHDLALLHLFWFEKVFAELFRLKCGHLHLLGASSPGMDGVSAGKNILKMPLLLDKSIIFNFFEKNYYRT